MPADTFCAAMEPTAFGARFTVTAMTCEALSMPSLAVAVTSALPAATAVIFNVAPVKVALATLGAEDFTVYVSVSSSASLNLALRSMLFAVPPTVTVTAAMVPTFSGASLSTTVALNVPVTVADPSLAVTVIVAAPSATEVIFSVESETPTVTLPAGDTVAEYDRLSPSGSLK